MESKEASSEIAERMKPETISASFPTTTGQYSTCTRTKIRPSAVESTQGLWETDVEDENDGIRQWKTGNGKGIKIALLGSILR
jgi:hypothetical protein